MTPAAQAGISKTIIVLGLILCIEYLQWWHVSLFLSLPLWSFIFISSHAVTIIILIVTESLSCPLDFSPYHVVPAISSFPLISPDCEYKYTLPLIALWETE